MNTLDKALDCVRSGILSVDAQGRVWRTGRRMRGGEVRTIKAQRADKPSLGRCDYRMVFFRFPSPSKMHAILAHRLVWSVLRGPIPEGHGVNHIDGNKTNNHPSNLEVCTQSENLKHAYRTGLSVPYDRKKVFAHG